MKEVVSGLSGYDARFMHTYMHVSSSSSQPPNRSRRTLLISIHEPHQLELKCCTQDRCSSMMNHRLQVTFLFSMKVQKTALTAMTQSQGV